MGNIVKNLIDECILGVSSRGLGSLKERDGINEVQDDFVLSTAADIVDPSAPDAFVRGIMEHREWVMVEGVWMEKEMEQSYAKIKNASSRELEEEKNAVFSSFLDKLSKI